MIQELSEAFSLYGLLPEKKFLIYIKAIILFNASDMFRRVKVYSSLHIELILMCVNIKRSLFGHLNDPCVRIQTLGLAV